MGELDDVKTTIAVIDELREKIAALEAENERLRIANEVYLGHGEGCAKQLREERDYAVGQLEIQRAELRTAAERLRELQSRLTAVTAEGERLREIAKECNFGDITLRTLVERLIDDGLVGDAKCAELLGVKTRWFRKMLRGSAQKEADHRFTRNPLKNHGYNDSCSRCGRTESEHQKGAGDGH